MEDVYGATKMNIFLAYDLKEIRNALFYNKELIIVKEAFFKLYLILILKNESF